MNLRQGSYFLAGLLSAMAVAAVDKAPAAEPRLTVQPYITWVTTDSVSIQWETDLAGSSEVQYGPTCDYGRMTSAAGESRVHKVVVSGLSPGTSYHYRVLSRTATAAVSSSGHTFRAAPGPNGPFSFAFLGDTHTRDGGPPFAPDAPRVAEAVLRHKPNLVLHSGDVIKGVGSTSRTDTEQQYRTELFGTLGHLMACTPLLNAIGDHERRGVAGDKVYAAYFDGHQSPYWGKTYFTFTYGSARFIILDVVITGDHAEGVEVPGIGAGSAQYKWLVEVLDKNTMPWVFLCYHYATYHSHPRFQQRDEEMRALVGPLCDRYGVDLVMAGHAHLYERTFPIRAGVRDDAKGTVYVAAGIGGGSLMTARPGSLTAAAFSDHGYGIVTVAGGKLTLRVYDVGGSLRDSCTLADRRPDPGT